MINRYDVIEYNSKRIETSKYENELILIDLNTYKRVKLKFITRSSGFSISREYYPNYELKTPIHELCVNVSIDRKQEIIPNKEGNFVEVEYLD